MSSMGLMVRCRTRTPLPQVSYSYKFLSALVGVLNVPTHLVRASAGHQHVRTATGIFLTIISVGGAIDSAISGSLHSRAMPAK